MQVREAGIFENILELEHTSYGFVLGLQPVDVLGEALLFRVDIGKVKANGIGCTVR